MYIIPPETFTDMSLPEIVAWCGGACGLLSIGFVMLAFF